MLHIKGIKSDGCTSRELHEMTRQDTDGTTRYLGETSEGTISTT